MMSVRSAAVLPACCCITIHSAAVDAPRSATASRLADRNATKAALALHTEQGMVEVAGDQVSASPRFAPDASGPTGGLQAAQPAGTATTLSARQRVSHLSAKPVEYFRTNPGGYFHGMVAKSRRRRSQSRPLGNALPETR